jgi:hypothetical protein
VTYSDYRRGFKEDQSFNYLPIAFITKKKKCRLSIYQFRCDTFKEYSRMQRFLSKDLNLEENVPEIKDNLQLYPLKSNQIVKGKLKRGRKVKNKKENTTLTTEK